MQACPKCQSPKVLEWDCFCLTGCDCCNHNRQCQDCNHLFREKTEADRQREERLKDKERQAIAFQLAQGIPLSKNVPRWLRREVAEGKIR